MVQKLFDRRKGLLVFEGILTDRAGDNETSKAEERHGVSVAENEALSTILSVGRMW